MKIKRIAHIAIAARTLAPAIDLFRDIFGIAPAYEAQIGSIRLAMLPVGATCPELLESRDEVLAAIGDAGPQGRTAVRRIDVGMGGRSRPADGDRLVCRS